METELNSSIDNVALCAAYLSKNIEFIANDIEPKKKTVFSQSANSIMFIILPRYHRGLKVDCVIETGTALAELALLKLMHVQSQELVSYIGKKDRNFADWVNGCLMDFIAKAARKYQERNSSQLSGVLSS
ncbi:hypothetical protein [Pantoea cypripedii]|uniref:Uncharacterized protein n=1 Tax=Pantoea cypripedii TaxID=55209 RepID=A0A6B9FYG7_PANCY|nr:hypothetical protein [Pantoea cypripedii]QGY29048.1 hypothetical protein CUN67_08945 [Pantoea cypripedii]